VSLPHGTPPPDSPDPLNCRQADAVASVRLQHTNQGRPGPLPTKRPATSRSAPTADWCGRPVRPGRQTRQSPPNRAARRNCRGLAADVYRGLAAPRALMGVGELIYTVWGATMGGWPSSTVIPGRHCVGGGLYEGHVEMYVGTCHPLAQNNCLKNQPPISS
jgi:hypothetical protein